MTPVRFGGLLLVVFLVGLGAAFRFNNLRVTAGPKGFAPAKKDGGNPAWDLLSRARALQKGRMKQALDGDAAEALLSGDKDKAIALLDEAIREERDDAFLYFFRGLCYAGKKDYDKAISDYDSAIRLEGTDALYYLQRGNAYRDKREYDRAIADHTEAIRLESDSPGGYTARALDYEKLRQFNNALEDHERAIKH